MILLHTEKKIDYIVLEIRQNFIQMLKQSIKLFFSLTNTTEQRIKNPFTIISQIER